MNHKKYVRMADNKKTAVLMIHGILGTPRHFDCIMDVIPEEWSIINILLDGHGKEVKDFSRTSMKKWKHQVLKIMSRLNKEYEEIVIVGHSMGTLLGIMASFAYPQKVKCMFLLNVPLKVHMRPMVVSNAVKILLKKETRDTNASNMKMSGSIRVHLRLWEYLGWIPRYLELFQLVRQTRERIDSVRIPTWSFQSRGDELVSNRSISYLENHPVIVNQVLEHSGHFGYSPEDLEVIKKTMRQVINVNI